MSDAFMPLPGGGTLYFDDRSREEAAFLVEEIFGDDNYLQHGVTLEPGAIVVDAGANIGLFTIFAARHAPARIFAFEPVPAIHRLLSKNVETNRVQNVTVFDRGLTRKGGDKTATFAHFVGLPASSTMHTEAKLEELERFREAHLAKLKADHPVMFRFIAPAAKKRLEELARYEEVTCTLDTLEDVVAAEGLDRIDLLKVDVEGAELDVLDGVGDAWPIVRQVVLETHGDERAAEAQSQLEDRGFEVVVRTPKFAEPLGLDNRALWARRPVR